MSVQSQINRLKQNVSDAFAAVGDKGGTVPSSKVIGNLVEAINSIPAGVGAVLTVTAPSGVTVEVSKDGEVKTQTSNSEGLAVFTGLETGTWTVSIMDGEQTITKPVVITANYSTTIAFFSATINITYPAGSTCTCSDGTTTFTAPDTSGTWKCVVSNKGTWTVSCTNGTESTSETVEITADGQSVAVELVYWHGELYDSGNEYTFITGGWQARGLKVDPDNNAAAPTIVKGSNNVTISQSSYACGGVYEIVKNFDLTEFNTLTFNVAVGSATGVFGLIVYDRNITSTGNGSASFSNTLAYKQLQPGASGSFNIDVSGVNKAACIGIAVYNWVASATPCVTMTKAFVS